MYILQNQTNQKYVALDSTVRGNEFGFTDNKKKAARFYNKFNAIVFREYIKNNTGENCTILNT